MSYVDSDTTRAMLAFMKAAKAIEGQIQKLARGELGESARDGARKVFEAINRLDDRAYKPEIRGDAKANDLAYAMSSRLRRDTVVAEERGFEKVRQAREAESTRLRQKIRDEAPRPGTYEHELAMMRVNEDARRRGVDHPESGEEATALARLNRAIGKR
jgi:hypothetical protein